MNKKTLIFLSALVIIVLLFFLYFNNKKEPRQPINITETGSWEEQQSLETAIKEPRQPINFTQAGSWEEKSLDTLIYESDAIVVGYFESVMPSRWNTENGNLPGDATFETIVDNNLYIYTEYIFKVEEFIKGNQSENSIVIRTFGGQVGEDSMSTGSGDFVELSQTYLLFLHNTPRLAQLGNPFLVYDPMAYSISDGIASSWTGEQNAEELKNYIRNSPFLIYTNNITETPEVLEIMERIKTSHTIEVEAKNSSDLSKLPEIFINDPRFILNSERLEFVKSILSNPDLESAGYLDFKIAYIQNGFDPNSGYETPLDSIWIEFISLEIQDDIANVVYQTGSRRKLVSLIKQNDDWFIAGSKGITTYEDNISSSLLEPNITITPAFQEVIKVIEINYPDRIIQFFDIDIDKETAIAYIYDGYSAKVLFLEKTNETWQITETKE